MAKEQTDVDRLEAEMTATVTEVSERWRRKAEQVEAVTIGGEKTDVQVDPPILVWVPVGS
ncbi:MAG: hypothetical protein V1757_10735 [Actinomycetota bacterium]